MEAEYVKLSSLPGAKELLEFQESPTEKEIYSRVRSLVKTLKSPTEKRGQKRFRKHVTFTRRRSLSPKSNTYSLAERGRSPSLNRITRRKIENWKRFSGICSPVRNSKNTWRR